MKRYRSRAIGRAPKRRFSRTAMKTNKKNIRRSPMRGGYRL